MSSQSALKKQCLKHAQDDANIGEEETFATEIPEDFLSDSSQMVLAHQSMGVRLAWKFLSSWHIRLEPDEVKSLVNLALCEAALRFDFNRGVTFRTFFFYHLRGILIKHITVLYRNSILYVSRSSASSSDEDYIPRSSELWFSPLVDRDTPETLLCSQQISQRLKDVCAELDPVEQQVITRHFYFGESLHDIARELDYCRCHLSRVKSKALKSLASKLSNDDLAETQNDRPSLANRTKTKRQILSVKTYSGGRGRRQSSLAEAHRANAVLKKAS